MLNRHTILQIVSLALAAVGCSKPGGQLGKNPRPAVEAASTTSPVSEPATNRTEQSVLERLQQMSKKGPVIFVASSKGLAAFGGDEVEILVPGTSVNVRGNYSPIGLFWYLDGQVLSVLDLRKQKPKPVRILEGVPPISRIDIHGGLGTTGYGAGFETVGSRDVHRALNLDFGGLGDSVGLRPRHGLDITATKIVGLAWLNDAKKNHDGKPVRRVIWRKTITKLPKDVGYFRDCDVEPDDGECQGAAFGTSGWVLFQSFKTCGGADCITACKLSDGSPTHVAMPAAQPLWLDLHEDLGVHAVADPPNLPDSTCGPYFFDFNGKNYFTEQRTEVCTIGRGCKPVDGKVLDFFDHGDAVSLVGAWLDPYAL